MIATRVQWPQASEESVKATLRVRMQPATLISIGVMVDECT